MYIFWYVNMPNVTEGYGWFSDLMRFYWNFHILLNVWPRADGFIDTMIRLNHIKTL